MEKTKQEMALFKAALNGMQNVKTYWRHLVDMKKNANFYYRSTQKYGRFPLFSLLLSPHTFHVRAKVSLNRQNGSITSEN